jgi:hypothetical protein
MTDAAKDRKAEPDIGGTGTSLSNAFTSTLNWPVSATLEACHGGSRRPDQVRRELLREPGDGPQALEVLDDSPEFRVHWRRCRGFPGAAGSLAQWGALTGPKPGTGTSPSPFLKPSR